MRRLVSPVWTNASGYMREGFVKSKTAFPAILLVLLLCTVFASGKDNREARTNYEKALAQLKSGNLNIDFKQLRLNCAASDYECQADSDDTKLLYRLLNERKFDEALKKANQMLEKVFVDAELHYIAFVANMESSNKERAELHKGIIRGLLDSIQENKRGRSEEDAFVVINVHEEYTFLRFSNMQVTKQALRHKDGHTYDVMTCKDMSGSTPGEITAYFNVDIPTQQMRDALEK